MKNVHELQREHLALMDDHHKLQQVDYLPEAEVVELVKLNLEKILQVQEDLEQIVLDNNILINELLDKKINK